MLRFRWADNLLGVGGGQMAGRARARIWIDTSIEYLKTWK